MRKVAALFQASLRRQEEEESSPVVHRPGKQIETDEDRSGLFRAGGSGLRSETVTRFGEDRNHDEITWKTRKIEIPLFDGENAESWVLRVEQYFELCEFLEEGKLLTVRMCFDGEALLWYRWEHDWNPFVSWEKMKYRVLEKFSTSYEMTARERLMTLKQEGTVRKYCQNFISVATNAPEIPDEVLEMGSN